MDRLPELAILGAGAVGLAVGYYPNKDGIPFTIYEASERIEGNSTTFQYKEFLFDSGAHRFHDQYPEITKEMQTMFGKGVKMSLIYRMSIKLINKISQLVTNEKFVHKMAPHLIKIAPVTRRITPATKADFNLAKKQLLRSSMLSADEKNLIEKVSLRVHRNDVMYTPTAAAQYLSLGLEALRCIEDAFDLSNQERAVRHILDFPCGYGRVLRFLKARFPDSNIIFSEIDQAALDFCSHQFQAKSLKSCSDFNNLSLSIKFDLIWCGSLITHISEKRTIDLLKFFYRHLSPHGLCIFTTHGKVSVEMIQEKTQYYGLSEKAQAVIINQFYKKGYGYADYDDTGGYGISVVSHDRMAILASKVGDWKESFYRERGWGDHQDVYGFINAAADG